LHMAADPATTAKKLEPSELIGAAQQVAIVRILVGLDAEASKWATEAERLELVVDQWGEPEPEPEPESSFDNTHDNSTDSDGPPTPIQATALGTMPATRDADAEVARLEVAAEVARLEAVSAAQDARLKVGACTARAVRAAY
jgi:hypothetical protein